MHSSTVTLLMLLVLRLWLLLMQRALVSCGAGMLAFRPVHVGTSRRLYVSSGNDGGQCMQQARHARDKTQSARTVKVGNGDD